MNPECYKAGIRELCDFHGGPDPDCPVSKASRGFEREGEGCNAQGWERRVGGGGRVLGEGTVPAPGGQGQRKRMCRGHWRFEVQVVRRQGGAGLPSAVGLALVGSAYAVAGLRSPPGLSGCGLLWLCWKAPGLLGKPEGRAGCWHRLRSRAYPSTGPEGSCSGPNVAFR